MDKLTSPSDNTRLRHIEAKQIALFRRFMESPLDRASIIAQLVILKNEERQITGEAPFMPRYVPPKRKPAPRKPAIRPSTPARDAYFQKGRA